MLLHTRIRQRFWIKEQKKGKRQEVVINDSIQEVLEEYLTAYPEITGDHKHFIFFNTKANSFMQPIRRGQSWKVITTICRQVGLRGNFGTHSLRKTWGYHARMQGVDLALIMHKLNHDLRCPQISDLKCPLFYGKNVFSNFLGPYQSPPPLAPRSTAVSGRVTPPYVSL